MEKYFDHVESINYEAQQFLLHFRRFRKNINAIDETLRSSFLKIVSEIDNFLESKPKAVYIPNTKELINPDAAGVRRNFVCTRCKKEIGLFKQVRPHILSREHWLNSRREAIINATISMKARLKNKILPRSKSKRNRYTESEVKSLLLGDSQTLYMNSMSVAKKLQNLSDYSVIENDLLTLIQPAFPNKSIKVYFTGSRISGIGTISSDLDMFIDIGNVFNTYECVSSPETIKNLQVVQHLLEKSPCWMQMRAIRNAPVPILRVCHASTTIACDIGFSNSLAFCNTKLIQYFLELQPIAKALCLVLKKLLQRIKLSKYITTYSAVLLVVFYLQVKKQLPSVKTLQDDLEDPIEIGPCIATFSEKTLADLNILKSCVFIYSLRQELKQFFTFYSSFNFSEDLICPYLGHIVSMDKMGVDPLLQRYAKYIENEKDTKGSLFENAVINVQDPFQLNYNVTNMVPATAVLLMKQYFELSANVLSDAAFIIPVERGMDSVQNSTT